MLLHQFKYFKLNICKPFIRDSFPFVYFIVIKENIVKTVFKEIYWLMKISNPTKRNPFLSRY
ncbi:hypothetical protein CFM97_12520 [Klebsiella michiganensis]|nr:hypothetical protein [Klebsiella michiganensis]